jgi:hypothetical protein
MSTPNIESYEFGHIVIDGQTHDKDVIILPGGVIGNWWRDEGHSLHPNDLEPVFAAKPDVLVIGQGAYGRMQVPAETRQAIEDAGIQVIEQKTTQAYQTYNQMRTNGNVAAALHLTC